jgi:hypothetical protein
MNPLQRLIDPQELADAALFLSEGWLANAPRCTRFWPASLAQLRDVVSAREQA